MRGIDNAVNCLSRGELDYHELDYHGGRWAEGTVRLLYWHIKPVLFRVRLLYLTHLHTLWDYLPFGER